MVMRNSGDNVTKRFSSSTRMEQNELEHFLAFLTFAIKVIGYLNEWRTLIHLADMQSYRQLVETSEKVMLQLIEGMGAKLSEGM
jgi:hypothetical protein